MFFSLIPFLLYSLTSIISPKNLKQILKRIELNVSSLPGNYNKNIFFRSAILNVTKFHNQSVPPFVFDLFCQAASQSDPERPHSVLWCSFCERISCRIAGFRSVPPSFLFGLLDDLFPRTRVPGFLFNRIAQLDEICWQLIFRISA